MNSTDLAVINRECDKCSVGEDEADPDANCSEKGGNGTSDLNVQEPTIPVTIGISADKSPSNNSSSKNSSIKKNVTFVIPARPDVYTYESEGQDRNSDNDDGTINDNNHDETEDEIVDMIDLHPEPENTKLNSSSVSVSDYVAGKSPIPEDSIVQYPTLESPKQLRFALNVRFTDETGGSLEEYYQSPLSPQSPSSATSSDRSRSPEMTGGFESANGRLQRFKQLILQASLRKQKMIFSPSKQRSNGVQSRRGNHKGNMHIPASDTKASVMARSRRYDEIIRREEAQLSKPLAELCWDNSPANQDFRRATKANRHYWNQVRMLSASEHHRNFGREDQDNDDENVKVVNDSARGSVGIIFSDEIRNNIEVEGDLDGGNLGSTSRNLFVNKDLMDDGYVKIDDGDELKNNKIMDGGDEEMTNGIYPNYSKYTENKMNTINYKEDAEEKTLNDGPKLRIRTSFDSLGETSLPGSLESNDALDGVDSELDLQLGGIRRLPVSQAGTSPMYFAYANMLESQEFKGKLLARQETAVDSTQAKIKTPANLSPSSSSNLPDTATAASGLDVYSSVEEPLNNQTSPWTSVVFIGEDDRRRARSSTFGSFDDGSGEISTRGIEKIREISVDEESTVTSESTLEFQEDENCPVNDGKGQGLKTRLHQKHIRSRKKTVSKSPEKKIASNKNLLKVKKISSPANNDKKDSNEDKEKNAIPNSSVSDAASAVDEENKEDIFSAIPPTSMNKPKIRPVVPFNGSHFTSGLPPLRRLGQKAPLKIEVESIETDTNEAQLWQPVVHPETGKTYYWNSVTNETTPLDAPDPNKFRIKTVSSPDVRHDSPNRTNLYHEDTNSHISPTYPYPSNMMNRREKLFDPSYTRLFNQRIANLEKPRSPISSNIRKPVRKYDYTGRVNPSSVPDFPDVSGVNTADKTLRKNNYDNSNARGLMNPKASLKTNVSNQQQLQQAIPKAKAPLAKSVQIKLSKTQKIIQEKRKLEAKKEKREKNKMYW